MKTILFAAPAFVSFLVLSACAPEEVSKDPVAQADPAAEKAAVPEISKELAELLPEELIKVDGSKVPVSSLAGKPLVGIYFSAHWCGPCRGFTPHLVNFRDANTEDIEIVFVSSDRDDNAMMNYMSEYKMKWLAVPKDSPKVDVLKKKSGHRGIPTLMILRADGSIAALNGRGDVTGNPDGAIAKWKEGQ